MCGCGGPALSTWLACPLKAACRGGGRGASPGGWPATVVRGVWGQALSLPWPPVLWGEQPGFRDPCVPRAVGAGVGTVHQPHSVQPCGPALRAVGVAGWRPLWGAFCHCEGRLRSGAPPPLWAGCRGPLPMCSGRGSAGVGAQHCPLGLHALWGLRAAGSVGGRPRGGPACHRCEKRLVTGAVPPPAARPLGRAAGFPRPVCPGCGWCVHGDPAPAPQRAPLRAGVARCWGGGRAPRGGCLSLLSGASEVERSPPPGCPPSGRAVGVRYALWAGCRGPLPTCCGRGCAGVGAQHCPLGLHALWGMHAAGVVGGRPRGEWPSTVVRGVWCQALSLPRPPVLWGGRPGFCDPCVPGAVGVRVGTQHLFHSVRPLQLPATPGLGGERGPSPVGWSGHPARPVGSNHPS